MKVSKLSISNFRGVRDAILFFDGHTLLVGKNNIGKSTICEALDLVLGPDRLNKPSAIDEYDFYNGDYYYEEGEEQKEIRVEVVLTDISKELKSIFAGHLEFWHNTTQVLLEEGEVDQTDDREVEECLRLTFIGYYDREEDEFIAKTFYAHSPGEEEGVLTEVTKSRKRQIGFLYLRALRTGRRALSLERGTLLDILLRVGEIRPKFWEETRQRLLNLDPPLDESIGSLRNVLDNIEQRIGLYIPLATERSTTLHVSQLTREHLRKTLAFFMTTSANQLPVPFGNLGTGTLSTLVFALLSAIAELKKENIIFAMEEPELAIPPHTQRRIINYLLSNTSQSFVTSHSPYVIEMFEPADIKILRKDSTATVKGKNIHFDSGIKPKNYKRKLRHAIAESILGNAVIVGEGLTEHEVLYTAATILETTVDNYPIDLSGVTIFDAGGDGMLLEYGKFFQSIDLRTFAFFDNMDRTQDQIDEFDATFEYYKEIPYKGIEKLLVTEIPVEIQWQYLVELRDAGEFTNGPVVPPDQPSDDDVRTLCFEVLKQKKGENRAASLVSNCSIEQLPSSIVEFFDYIYQEFPKPEDIQPINFSDEPEDQGGNTDGEIDFDAYTPSE